MADISQQNKVLLLKSEVVSSNSFVRLMLCPNSIEHINSKLDLCSEVTNRSNHYL